MGTIMLVASLATSSLGLAQLNNSNEIIETIQDIQIQDDSSSKKKESSPNKPQFDEEFGKKQPVQEEIEDYESEENIAEPESSPQEQKAERKEIGTDEKESYENELEKNARKNRFERKEISPEDLKRFEVDAVPEEINPEEPAKQPVVGTPQEQKPAEALEPEDEFEEELSQIPEETPEEESVSRETEPTQITPEEKPGPTIYYSQEESGPKIPYKNEKTISDEERERLSEKTKVEIEEDPYIEGSLSKNITDYLKPYKQRRPSWTTQMGVGVNQFVPMNYASDISGDDFELAYEDSKIPSPEFSLEFKKNFSFAAIALGLEAAYYSTSNDFSDFTLIMPTVKATLYLDTLFDEPYVVPYGSVGLTYMMYEEAPTDGSEGFKGKTDNMFISVGALFQLDWLDPRADAMAYSDMGIENTFVYVEARTYLDQGIARKEGDADFSSDTHVAGGVRLEF